MMFLDNFLNEYTLSFYNLSLFKKKSMLLFSKDTLNWSKQQ